jgi:hypothetical protein
MPSAQGLKALRSPTTGPVSADALRFGGAQRISACFVMTNFRIARELMPTKQGTAAEFLASRGIPLIEDASSASGLFRAEALDGQGLRSMRREFYCAVFFEGPFTSYGSVGWTEMPF